MAQIFKDNFTHHEIYYGDIELLIGTANLQVQSIHGDYGKWSIVKKAMLANEAGRLVLIVEVE